MMPRCQTHKSTPSMLLLLLIFSACIKQAHFYFPGLSLLYFAAPYIKMQSCYPLSLNISKNYVSIIASTLSMKLNFVMSIFCLF